jgi:hypothetical protein
MKLLPLDEVKSQVKVGAPLPFGIRDEHGNLLLSRGHRVDSEAQLNVLLQRGAMVDFEEVPPAGRKEAIAPPPENFAGRWHQLTVRAGVHLRPPLTEDDALDHIREIAEQVQQMAERNPDMLLYLALRTARDPGAQYGVLHALHAAVVAALIVQRLQWPAEHRASLLGAALTMNLSIAELQSRLHGSAQQALPPAQREMIDRHPGDSAALLRQAGLEDEVWLQTVEQHHPQPAGTPAPEAPVSDAVRLLRLVDAYTTRITERADTIIASPALAAREMYAQHGGDPFALSLVKEMGVYPPGTFVRIASGETAVVLRRGHAANAPEVACVTNKRGDALQTPIRRDTSLLPEHAVTAVVPDKEVRVRFPSQQLYA